MATTSCSTSFSRRVSFSCHVWRRCSHRALLRRDRVLLSQRSFAASWSSSATPNNGIKADTNHESSTVGTKETSPAGLAAPALFESSPGKDTTTAATTKNSSLDQWERMMGKSLQPPAGRLVDDPNERLFIPAVALHASDGRHRKRVLILCTGGTLTMAPDADGALAPVEGALSAYMRSMHELNDENMPEYVLHEYKPFYDSSDLGPADWARLAHDVRANYLHFDGFVILCGTDTMAYCATALSFMLENLGKPVVFTGSQIPLSEPYNDGRRNLIMALIFASRDTINEVSIFFHDRLLRACRTTKKNTHKLLAFDSPNIDPLATIGITIDENEHLILPPPRGSLRVHTRLDTRLLTIRLVPGFDDTMIAEMIQRRSPKSEDEEGGLTAIVLQLYGTGNLPAVKQSFIQLLADASEKGILVVAATQCYTGSVMLGHYAVGKALEGAGVVSANDMTFEAIACKVGYLFGRGDLTHSQVAKLMGVSLRGEVTPSESLSPPPFSSAYQRALRKGKTFY